MNTFVMTAVSLISGLLSSMNNWVVDKSHVYFHLNDLYMTLLMTGWMMALYGIFFHPGLDLVFWILMITASFYAIRSQLFIDEGQFLKGMIPHHSMAILMSREMKKKTDNPELIKLLDNIIVTQVKEIKQMKQLLDKKN